jgi:hypothetical protein
MSYVQHVIYGVQDINTLLFTVLDSFRLPDTDPVRTETCWEFVILNNEGEKYCALNWLLNTLIDGNFLFIKTHQFFMVLDNQSFFSSSLEFR